MENERPSHYNTFLIAAIIVAVLLVGAIFVAFLRREEVKLNRLPNIIAPSLPPKPSQLPKSISQPIPAAPDAIVNPVEKLPKTNPFEAKTNPYKGYRNPFE